MEISIKSQLIITLYSAILGTFFGFIYDFFRIGRIFYGINYVEKYSSKIKAINLPLIKNPYHNSKKRKSENVFVGIGDILYFIIISLILILFIYYFNSGIVRWYIFLGVTVGFVLYYFTLGKLIIFISEFIVFGIKIFFSYLLFSFSFPLKKLFSLVKNYCRIIYNKVFISVKQNITAKKKEKKKNQSNKHFLIGFGKQL